ncbi:TIGR00282 family metallophosphoesterase [Candidatus Babeliales bacterium]|nr:TIGR00282 family metallophosphoesterase [Candidatus Babeliales bacterium]
MREKLKFLFFGDLIGRPGRALFQKWANKLKEQFKADAIIINGENSADNGRGITPSIAQSFFDAGASAITSGNHIWFHKNVHNYLDEESRIIRPANYPSSCPGKGYTVFEVEGHSVALLNLQGRVFMHDDLDCPFRTAESLYSLLRSKAQIIFVDFHAEATSEKQGLGYFLDGKVSGVVGTHTHVQTADEKILPNGTAYITDLGFSGNKYSMLGLKKEPIIDKFLTQMPHRFVVELKGPFVINGVCIEVDTNTGKASKIERIRIEDDNLQLIE